MTRKGCPQPTWTRKQEMQAARMKEDGTPIAEIAAALGKTYGAVSVRLSKLGATKQIGRIRRKPGEFLAAVADLCGPHMRRKRMSDGDIAAALDVYPQEVFLARKKLGIPRQISPHECGRRSARSRYGNCSGGHSQQGRPNDTPLTDEQRQLAARYVKLAYRVASDWMRANPRADRDEVFSAANLGLVRAARSKDVGCVSFGLYASKTIRLTIQERIWRTRCPLGFREARQRQFTPPKIVQHGREYA